MIHGIGVDLVTISRVSATHERFGARFAMRILNQNELAELDGHSAPARFLAKRFAVKEAAVKALGTGERHGVLLKDFSLAHDGLGKPELEVSGRAAELCLAHQITGRHVSLSDELDQVVAYVILERQEVAR